MGTNVYAYRKNLYTDEVLDKYAELAKKHDINGIVALNEKLQEETEENRIHIGKRSAGWKFLFNHNNWKYYDYTRKSIDKFLRSCFELRKENDDGIITVDEFWKEYVDDFKDGFDGKGCALNEIKRAKEKEEGKINDPYNFIMSLENAQRCFNEAQAHNFYEEKYYGNKLIPYKNLDYRFGNSIWFA